jgi:beta-N-acetylhexosaminidase
MNEEQINRQKRKRRRIRNQILAYLTLIVLLAVIVTAGYHVVKGVRNSLNGYSDKVNRVLEEAESNAATEAYGDNANTSDSSSDDTQTVDDGMDEALDQLIGALLSDMTIEEMVSGMFIVSPEAITGVGTVVQAGDGTKNALATYPVGGLIYSASNFKDAEQFTQMLSNTNEFSLFPLFLAVKAESGDTSSFGIESVKASELTDTDSVKQSYTAIAQTLSQYGINLNLAPVADVVAQDGDATLQGRTFGSDATAAAPLVNAAVQSMQDAQVSAVLQKFPSSNDTSKSLEELNNSEFVVYNMAIQNGVDCIMVSNATASELTGDDTPSSLSSAVVTDVLRGSLGFDRLVITDYLNDSAVTSKYSSGDAAVAAVIAGCDMLLEPADYQEAYNAVLQAVSDNTITRERIYESMYRIYRIKYKNALKNS